MASMRWLTVLAVSDLTIQMERGLPGHLAWLLVHELLSHSWVGKVPSVLLHWAPCKAFRQEGRLVR